MILEFHNPIMGIEFLGNKIITFIEASEALLFEDALEAMNDSIVFWIEQALIDKPHLNNLERLHDKHLGPTRNGSTDKSSH
jgi:hypothetical protein